MPEILRHLILYSECAAQVDEVIAEILQLLRCLAAEHVALHEWRKDAETHFRDGDALDIGAHLDAVPLSKSNCRQSVLYLRCSPSCHHACLQGRAAGESVQHALPSMAV